MVAHEFVICGNKIPIAVGIGMHVSSVKLVSMSLELRFACLGKKCFPLKSVLIKLVQTLCRDHNMCSSTLDGKTAKARLKAKLGEQC